MLASGVVLVGLLATLSCAAGGGGGVSVPPPPVDVYAEVPDFAGVWLGEVGGQMGELGVRHLAETRYYGTFVSDDQSVRFVLNMRQQTATARDEGAPIPGNLVTFEWQDGQDEDVCDSQGCGRGLGWVLINPEDTALSGMIGFGDSNANRGRLSFVRVDEEQE